MICNVITVSILLPLKYEKFKGASQYREYLFLALILEVMILSCQLVASCSILHLSRPTWLWPRCLLIQWSQEILTREEKMVTTYYCHGRMLDLQHIAEWFQTRKLANNLSQVPVLPLQAQYWEHWWGGRHFCFYSVGLQLCPLPYWSAHT